MQYFVIIISLFLFSCSDSNKEIASNSNIEGWLPVPTEFSIKKTKRKEFKKGRKEYIENMHRSHPDDDWKKIDTKTRLERINKIKNIRNQVSNNDYEGFFSRNISGTWYEKGSNNLSGRIRTADIDWDNNIIYCASSGGNIWKGSINNNINGQNWISLNDYMQIKGITMLRYVNNINRILIATGYNFFYTDNEGVTFETSQGLDFLDEGFSIKRAIVRELDNAIYLLVDNRSNDPWGTVAAIYKSVDNGQFFSKILTLDSSNGFDPLLNSNNFDIWTSRYINGDIYLLNNNKMYLINNFDMIEFIGDLPTTMTGNNILVGGSRANHKFLYAYVGNRIFKSINSGETWVDKGENPHYFFSQNSFNTSNINDNLIFVGGIDLYKSENSGNSWSLVNNWWEYYGNESTMLHADIPEVRFFLDNDFNEVALISTDGGIYVSYDEIETVDNLSMEGLGVSQYYSTYTKRTDPFHIYAGSQDQGFQRSLYPTDGILNFEQSISGDYGHLVSSDGGETLWCNYPGFTMFYANPETDGGGSSLSFPCSGQLWLPPLMEHPYDNNKVYLGGGGLDGGHHLILLRKTNSGITYTEEPYSFNGRVSAMAYSPIEPNYRYVLTDNGSFYYSFDSGQNWNISNSFDGPNAHYFYGSSIWASKSIPGKVLISGSGYSNPAIYVSYDHGQTFEAMDRNLPSTLAFKVVGTEDDSYYFTATEVGPYAYIPDEDTWINIMGVSAPDQTYWSVEYIDEINTARFGTYGRGIWDFVIDDSSVIDGDTNFDQVINVQDVIIIVNFILGLSEPTLQQFEASDINDDDIINVMDVIEVINIILEQ